MKLFASPKHDAAQICKGRKGVKTSCDQHWHAIPVEVAGGDGNQMRRQMRKRHGGKMFVTIVEPCRERDRFGVVEFGKARDRDNVFVSVVSVKKIGGNGTVTTGRITN